MKNNNEILNLCFQLNDKIKTGAVDDATELAKLLAQLNGPLVKIIPDLMLPFSQKWNLENCELERITIQDLEQIDEIDYYISNLVNVGELKQKFESDYGIGKENQIWIINGSVSDDSKLIGELKSNQLKNSFCLYITDPYVEFLDDLKALKIQNELNNNVVKNHNVAGNIIQDEVWICKACTFHNPIRSQRCGACNDPKNDLDDKNRNEQDIIEEAGSLFQEPNEDGEWICKTCTCRNSKNLQNCKLCLNLKNDFDNIIENKQDETQIADNLFQKATENGEWVCKACTFHNPIKSQRCGVCNGPKNNFDYIFRNEQDIAKKTRNLFQEPNEDEEWICKTCTYKNPKNRQRCKACFNPRDNINTPYNDDYDELTKNSL